MGDSNGSWGELSSHDPEMAEVWDSFSRLPDEGVNPHLDAFCERKGITIGSLLRLGARLSADHVLAFEFGAGIKYRDMDSGQRWSYTGSEWRTLKIVPAPEGGARTTCIVCEGETDAARLTLLYPSVDVAVLPAGARAFDKYRETYVNQLSGYELVLVGLDNDEAGDAGTAKIMEHVAAAMPFRPPANDWCDTAADDAPPLPAELERPPGLSAIVFGDELEALDVPDVASWFDNALLPIGGLLVMHAAMKSFKTFMALDMLSAIAQGEPWCQFEPTEEPARVCVIQFEIPWAYYKQRWNSLKAHASEPDLFRANFGTYTPLVRPRLVAGNTQDEDAIIRNLTENGVQVVLIDPVRRAMGMADMNAENEVRKMLHFFQRLNDEGITVVATHHDNKEAGKSGGGDPFGMTGSGAWAGDADAIVSIALPKGYSLEDPKRDIHFLLRNAPSPGPRGMEIKKDGQIVYQVDPWTDDKVDDSDDEGDVPIS